MEDYQYKISNGPDEHCEALAQEARDKNMTEGEGNYHFCEESSLFEEVMANEILLNSVPAEEPPWSGNNHKWRCKHWLRLYEKQFKKANVQTSADVRRLEDAGRRFPMRKL